VLHLHGRLARPYCQSCGEPWRRRKQSAPTAEMRIEPPLCARCGGRVRPGVVWFGESLPEREWLAAKQAAASCDVFFCIGTSSLVYPAASLTRIARDGAAVTIQVNPNPTEIEGAVDWSIRGPAGKVMPHILAAAFSS